MDSPQQRLIIDKAQEYIDKYRRLSQINKKWQQRYMFVWYLIGYPQIILSSVLTYLTSPNEWRWTVLVGVLSLCLSITLVFFDIRSKVEKFKETKLQYLDLINDIECEMLDPHGKELLDLMGDIIQKEKYIQAYAISPSECLSSCFETE